MTMKTCICIAGMPASGKTTAALRLSEKLGIAMLSKDEIKEKLFDRIGFQSRQEKVQLGLAAMEILYYAAERCLAAGQSVILENNFEDLSQPGLQALQERTGCRMITILFDGETRAVYERFVKRLAECGVPVQTGRFGADMQVSLQNDGPVTIILDTEEMMPGRL